MTIKTEIREAVEAMAAVVGAQVVNATKYFGGLYEGTGLDVLCVVKGDTFWSLYNADGFNKTWVLESTEVGTFDVLSVNDFDDIDIAINCMIGDIVISGM